MPQPGSAPALRLHLFGGFRAIVCGEPVPEDAWQRSSASAVIKLLATKPAHRLHREQIRESLWPDTGSASADGSLRKALYYARRALQPALPPRTGSAYLLTNGAMISLDDRVWIDVDHFEIQGQRALTGDDAASIQTALTAYGGELLPDERYEEWTIERRTSVDDLYVRLLLALAGSMERRGAYGAAIESLQRALERNSTREDIHRDLMRLYACTGRSREALKQFHSCCGIVREELDVDPEPETYALHDEIVRGAHPATASSNAVIRPDRSLLPQAVARTPLTPFIGREHALELLLEDLERTTAGSGTVVLLGGEAGVGKTRLAAEVAREAQRRGFMVLWGAGYEQEGLRPYGPFVEALDGYVGTRSDHERHIFAQAFPELVPLLCVNPSVTLTARPVYPEPASSNRASRFQLFTAVERLLGRLATEQPVLMILDDLHTADEGSFALLHHLARAAPQNRCSIVATYREEHVPAGSFFDQLCTGLVRRELCRRVYLLPLARSECDLLVRTLLTDGEPASDLLAYLFNFTLGNPLFIQELLGAMRGRKTMVREEGRWSVVNDDVVQVPRQVRAVIESHIRDLEPQVLEILSLAAVAGTESVADDLELAFTLTGGGKGETHLLDAIDRALDTRILEERDDAYAFRHPLFRAALFERLSRSRRTYLHGVLATAIEQTRPDAVELLAFHYGKSKHTEKALAYLERVGDRATAVYAWSIAEAHYRDLVERLDRFARPSDAARVREKLGLAMVDYRDEALTLFDDAIHVLEEAGDNEGVMRVTAHIAHWHRARGTPEEGLARMARVQDLAAGCAPSYGLALLHDVAAHLLFSCGQYGSALEKAEQASMIAHSINHLYLMADAEIRKGTLQSTLWRMSEAIQTLEASIILARDCGHVGLLTMSLNNTADTLLIAGRLTDCVRCLEEGDRLRQQTGSQFMITTLVEASVYLGHWTEASERLERDTTNLFGWFGAYVPLLRGHLHLRTGEWEEARNELETCISLAEPSHDLQALEYAHWLLGEVDILQRRPIDAVNRLHMAVSWQGPYLPGTLATLAWAYLELGEIGRAGFTIQKAHALVKERGMRLFEVEVLRVHGMVLACRQRQDEAHSTLQNAVRLARHIQYPYAEARALHELGVLNGRGEKLDAQDSQHFQKAIDIFRRLGARKDIERTTRALVNLGFDSRAGIVDEQCTGMKF